VRVTDSTDDTAPDRLAAAGYLDVPAAATEGAGRRWWARAC
jgi:hypothetical protein